MRNLKKLLAVIVAICVLATFTLPAFAADASYVNGEKAQKLYDLKLFSGTSTSTFVPNLGGSLTREQGIMLLIRLFGKEAEALAITDADTVLAKFSDYKKVSAYAKKHVAYAVKTGLVAGTSATTVGPQEAYTGDMIAAIILRELGFTGIDFNKSTATLAEKKVITAEDAAKLASKNLIRDDAVGIMFASLQAADSKGVTIIAKLVAAKIVDEAKAIAAGVLPATPAKLEVASATADNLKVAKIVFNKEVDSATVTNSNITAKDIDKSLITVKLGADKKTAYVIMPKQNQSANVEFTVENVKDTAGKAIEKTVKTVAFVDTTVPVVTGAVARNAKTIVISTNEPMSMDYPNATTFNNIKVDGIPVAASATVDFVNNTVTLNLIRLLTAGSHKIEIADLVDYATYKAVATTFTFDVVADTAAPVITAAEVKNTTTVEVTFNEDLDNKGSFTVDGKNVKSADFVDGNKSKLALTLNDALNTAAIVEIKVGYKDQTDVVGNKVATTTYFVFKVTDDTTLPTVAATVGSGNKITFVFSKTMATNFGKIKVVKGTSVLLPERSIDAAWFTTGKNNTEMVLPAADSGLASIDAADITVTLKDMRDATVRANALPEQNIPLKAGDTNAPKVTNGTFQLTLGKTADLDTITFYFTEAMDTATLNSLANYVIGGTSTTLAGYTSKVGNTTYSASISSVAADAMSVTIKVPNGRDIATFVLNALKDAAGNVMMPKTVGKQNDTSIIVTKVTAVAKNKFEVEFSCDVKSVDYGAFGLYKYNTTKAQYEMVASVYEIATSTSKASLTVNGEFGTVFDPSATNPEYKLFLNYPEQVKNVYGTAVATTGSWGIYDKVAATVSAEAVTSSGAITVTYSEGVNVAKADLAKDLIIKNDGSVVDNATLTLVYKDASGNVVADPSVTAFTKIEISGLKATTSYSIEIVNRSVKDVAGNLSAGLDKKDITTN